MPAPTTFPKIYTVNGPSSTQSTVLPQWLTIKSRAKRVEGTNAKKRTKTQHQLGQLELVQDFNFPISAIKIKTTEDGLHAIGTGTYKPMMKAWDLEQLTEKFQRTTDAENVDFCMLSSDWTKSIHLQRDRSLQLHTQGGLHHTIRLPTYGRALGYHSPSTDALVACSGTEVFRFNLEEGRYMTPLEVARGWGNGMESEVEGVNCLDVNRRHGLWSFGLDGAGGVIEFWDPRSRTALTRLTLPTSSLLPVQPMEDSIFATRQKLSITSLKSHPTDGLSLAVGTSSGHTLLYDIRSPTPFAVKDQGYGEPVRCIDWLRGGGQYEDSGRVVSADSKVIKVWDKNNPATNHLSLHPPNPLVDLHPVPESGLMFVACDASPLSTYYIPEFGPAPRWASFLDSVTERMAEDSSGAGKGAYTDYKFVDRTELETLGLTHLVGTPALKPYMHGFFLKLKLYQTARLIANPQSYAEHREKVVAERLAAKSESRIRAKRQQVKVNKGLAERLRKEAEREEALEKRKEERRKRKAEEAGVVEDEGEGEGEEEDGDGEKKTKVSKASLLSDPRFAEMFNNPDFEINEETDTFARLNPATASQTANGRMRTAVEEEEDDSDKSSSDGFSEDEESEQEEPSEASEEEESEDDEEPEEPLDSASGGEESDDGDLMQYDASKLPAGRARTFPTSSGSRPRLVVGGQGGPSRAETFGQRLHSSTAARAKAAAAAAAKPDGVLAMRKAGDGGMEMSYIPRAAGRGEDAIGADAEDEYSGGSYRHKKDKVERFAAGLEKGGEEDELEGEGRDGRTKRRHPGRSASKNVFRRR